MHRLFPFLRWLPDLRRPGVLRRDLVAGLSVAAIDIPQSMAYASLAGLPAVFGLYAAFLPPVVAAFWGSCHQLVTGPMATAALISVATVQAVAPPGSPDFVAATILLALLVGLLRLTLGLLRLGGVLVNLLSGPVVSGFANAAALIIASSQLPHLFGVPAVARPWHLESVWAVLRQLPGVHWPTAAMSLLSLALLLSLRGRRGKVLAAVAVATVVSWATGFPGEVVGFIQPGLPPLAVPRIDVSIVHRLLPGAVVLTVIGFTETMAIVKVIATRTRQRVDANQELIGQGLANAVGSFFHSFAISGSFTRSAVNLEAGAATGFSAAVTSAVIALTLLALTPLFHHLPQATLAAIIILAVLGLVRLDPILQAFRVSPADGLIAVATFLVTVALAPRLHWGILVGVGLSLMQYLHRTMRPHVAYLARHPDGALVDADAHNLALDQRIAIIRFDGRLYFGAASFFEDKVLEALARLPELRYLVFDAGGINHIDATGVQTLQRVVADLRRIGIDVHVTRMKDRVYRILARAGLVGQIGADHFHDWNQHALEHLWDQMEPAYRARCPLNVPTANVRSDVWSI